MPTAAWETDGALLTEFLTLNTGESPSEENASTLSQILQVGVPATYFLSPKACQGILRRASATLRAEAHHPPVVMESAGFCTEHSAKSRSIGYEEETSPTLRAGVVPATVYENHSQDTRYTGPVDTAPTVSATYGMGGNNQPFVVSTDALKTLKIRSGCEGGGKGALIQENKSATLSCNNDQTLFEPRAFGICSHESNSMKSANPHSGIYEADTSRTIDGNGGNPGCSQGGIAVVESYAIQGSMIGRDDKNGPQGDGINEDVSFTLNTVDRHGVYAVTTGSFTQVAEEQSPTLMARDFKDPAAICTAGYTVRRLTPTECARLQGFPDWWCDNLGIEPTAGCISMPRSLFTDSNLENLKAIIAAKGNLIKKALGTDELPIEVTDTKVSFPWFPAIPTPEELKVERKILLRNLTGSSAFRGGQPKEV